VIKKAMTQLVEFIFIFHQHTNRTNMALHTAKILTVTELTKRIKQVLEEGFSQITLQGEISNFKQHTSGHVYFTLKDEHAQIQAVLWRSRAQYLPFTPQDGMKVVVRGNVTVYEVRGVYQIDVVSLEPLGAGELQLAFERLKRKLADEGLFNTDRKRPLPGYPSRIGVVTSPTGAALQDILNILRRRCPAVEVILSPVKVQGAGAAEEIAAAIRDCNTYGAIDVLIVGRGGGSLEDLWPFNEEVVARAIFASVIPVVSAVGHEVDITIADYVADFRAPTPSAAAEVVTPTTAQMVEFVSEFYYTSHQRISDQITSKRDQIASWVKSYAFNRPGEALRQYSQRLDELARTMNQDMNHRIKLSREQLSSFVKRINSLNPARVLQRGFAIIRRETEIVPRAALLHPRERIIVQFHDGERTAVTEESKG
jgi:exodeoxyribonuclease VII large subunit